MNIDPGLLAGADQDLADANKVINDLIESWKDFRTDFDTVERVAMFAGSAKEAGIRPEALALLLTVAIKRLAAQ